MVPGMSSRAGALCAAARVCLQHGMAAASGSYGVGAQVSGRVPHSKTHQLFGVPSMSGKIPSSFTRSPSHQEHLRGREYWRSLEELANSDEFRALIEHESMSQTSLAAGALHRREFLRLMGASLALAGLTACGKPTPPDEKIVPFVKQPENLIPGKPRFFATAFTHHGAGTGVLVESHEGRPTKIEGNPLHPASLGATDAF